MKHQDYTLTVTLSNQPPVRIRTEDWPVIGYARDGEDRWIVIRRRKTDGTTLVSAVNRAQALRGGYVVPAGTDPDNEIREAAIDAELPDQLAEHAIGSMRAVPVAELPGDGKVAVRLYPGTWERITHRLRECGWVDVPNWIEEQI